MSDRKVSLLEAWKVHLAVLNGSRCQVCGASLGEGERGVCGNPQCDQEAALIQASSGI